MVWRIVVVSIWSVGARRKERKTGGYKGIRAGKKKRKKKKQKKRGNREFERQDRERNGI